MGRHVIDSATADLLLTGSLDPADAPPAYAGVARLIQAARSPAGQDELIRQEETVAAMVAAIRTDPLVVVSETPVIAPKERASLLGRPKRLALVVLAASLAATLALALVRLLPEPAQNFFHRIVPGIPAPNTGDITLGPGLLRVMTPEAPSPRVGLRIPGRAVVSPKTNAPSREGTSVRTNSGQRHEGPHRGSGERRTPATHPQPPATHPQPGPRPHESTEKDTDEDTEEDTVSTSGHGLCNAYFQGQGGVKGKKYQSQAFERLRAEAETQGQTVAEFCDASGGAEEAEHHNGKSKGKYSNYEGEATDPTSRTPGGGRGKRDSGPGGDRRSEAWSSHASRSARSTHGHPKK